MPKKKNAPTAKSPAEIDNEINLQAAILNPTKCGYVAIIGRPNVGKSTLLNRILGQKISITSPKPQTTRYQILGINTTENVQVIYIDTPGLHKIAKRAINRYMNRAASTIIKDVDVIIFMVDSLIWKDEDEWVLYKLKNAECPVILAVNKIDKIRNKAELLPFIAKLREKFNFAQIIPISAERGNNVEELEKIIAELLPTQAFIYPQDQVTDKSEKFLAAEIIREKLMRVLEQELPYAVTVEIEQFEREGKLLRISAIIWIEKPGQKAIVIGEDGAKLKKVGTQARLELQHWFQEKIFLRLWVKVKENWADDERALKNFGYE